MNQKDDWNSLSLKDLTIFIKDGTHGTHQDVDGGVPLLSAKDVYNNSLEIPDNCRRISEIEYQLIHKNYDIGEDDILLTVVGSIGRCYLVSGSETRFTLQRSVAIIRPNDIEPRYLYHYFCSSPFQQDLQDFTNASAQGGVYLGSLAKCFINFPISREEQLKIAAVLSTIDLTIAQTEAIITKQQRIKTGLMQDLLTKGIDENGNIRSEETHEFKDSPLGRIPVEWEVKELRDTGAWLSGGTPSKSEETYWGSPIPWVSSKDMKVFDLENTLEMITKKGALAGSKVVPKGSILIIVRGMILAHTFPVAYLARDMAFNQDIKAIIPNDNICGRYLAYWFLANSSNLLRLTTTATHGTKRLDTNELLEFSLSLPSKIEQNQIILLLDKLQYDIEISKEYLKKLIAKKTGLMQDLLTGKVRVTELLEDIDR